MSGRKAGAKRKAAILSAGLMLWRSGRLVSARGIASALGITHGVVLYHFKSSEALREAVAGEAVRTHDRDIVPILIAQKHPAAAGLSASERRRFALDIP